MTLSKDAQALAELRRSRAKRAALVRLQRSCDVLNELGAQRSDTADSEHYRARVDAKRFGLTAEQTIDGTWEVRGG